jgi:hypothetical protein
MEEDLGESKFRLNECPGGVHGHIAFEWFQPERTESTRRIAGWIEGERERIERSVGAAVRPWNIDFAAHISGISMCLRDVDEV